MMHESGYGDGGADNTDRIRRLKHSVLIRDDIRKLESFKVQNAVLKEQNPAIFTDQAKAECFFLYQHYADIFHRVLNDKLDLVIMSRVLTILKMIEDETIEQQEGSVLVGKLLKEMYIDSALQQQEKKQGDQDLDETAAAVATENKGLHTISWSEYKQQQQQQHNHHEDHEDHEDDEDYYADMPALIPHDSR